LRLARAQAYAARVTVDNKKLDEEEEEEEDEEEDDDDKQDIASSVPNGAADDDKVPSSPTTYTHSPIAPLLSTFVLRPYHGIT
jgi:hypothetical protein